MSKEYYFKITYKNTRNNNSVSSERLIARNMTDAKNQFRAKYSLRPEYKIIACVREQEYGSNARSDNPTSNSLGGALLGLAAVAGVALTSKFFGNKK
ncbi:hypothetical protein [Rodentibacter trehalosifermentans]|uniref:Uncharacterized protein n=1 Tax=Rodentibacter trehalosifermentans TaxID=1908263 RepID=A0A1V3IR88_9PAST|nr:hypothetical protein [Rodentibacter trehalosifermentans]OOF44560.1 hypothetical protein BKK51_08740 [Rodentibacter trehalosifermentans]OOF48202.1 hypothetical protein BKK53_10140 [Rodentibacter trehalosifermentans]